MTDAHVMVEVAVDPATAFDLFTRDIAAWWRADRSLFGGADDQGGDLRFADGLLLQGDKEIGRVSTWEPGPRLAFSYGPPDGDPAERTDVEVRFEAVKNGGTRVVLRHGGWEKQNWAGQLAGFARHSLERMLLARLGDFLDAIGAGDLDFFEQNLTENAMLIFPGQNTYTKAQCVAAMAGHPPYVKYDLADPHIVHIGESTAVLTHRATVMHEQNEKPRSIVVTSVLVHQDGDWRLALNQWTE